MLWEWAVEVANAGRRVMRAGLWAESLRRHGQPLAARAAIVLLVLLLGGCGGVRFLSGDDTRIPGQLFKPDQPGPLPAVVLLHDCAGLRSFHVSWAKTIQSAGYVAFLVDSFGPRGITNICADGSTMAQMATERVHDAYGALRYLKTLPFVDAQRVAVMGWSHGAWTVLEALSSYPYRTSAEQFRAGIALYPYCAPFGPSRFRAPLLILSGSMDDWTPAKTCVNLERWRHNEAPPLTVHVYDGAYHSFDDPTWGGATRSYLGHTLAYDAKATKDAEIQVVSFLRHYLQ